MARLKSHGVELARRETPTSRIAVMSDGHILRNQGDGWKLWKKVKPGVDVVGFAERFEANTRSIPELVHAYTRSLMDAVDLAHRWKLHHLITLMPEDVDGIWSQLDDYGYHPEFGDIKRACEAYRVAELAVRSEGVAVAE